MPAALFGRFDSVEDSTNGERKLLRAYPSIAQDDLRFRQVADVVYCFFHNMLRCHAEATISCETAFGIKGLILACSGAFTSARLLASMGHLGMDVDHFVAVTRYTPQI